MDEELKGFRQDMLPDESETDQDVSLDNNKPAQPPVNEDRPEADVPADSLPQEAPKKGDKTPDNRANAAFLEERQKRKDAELRAKIAEQKLKEKELSSVLSELDDNDLSEEGRMLKQQLAETNAKLAKMEQEKEISRVIGKNPALANHEDEFNEFVESRPSLSVEDAAKIFMADHGLIEGSRRKGLEKASSGGRNAPQSPGYTLDQVETMRVNNPKQYIKLLNQGAFDHLMS